MDDNKIFRIDIDGIIRSKSPKNYNKIPKFLISYLKKTVHQDDINGIIERNHDKYGVDFMNALISNEFDIKLNIKGEENIPQDGLFIFASNHPLGGLDGICLSAYLGNKYNGKIRYLVNDILLNIKNLETIFIPINKHGAQAKKSVEIINEAYASNNQIITFPAGLCSRKQDGKICDLEWMKNFISKATEYKRDIIPVHFDGKNSNFFYNLANFRKKAKIKFNIEMLYLPDEMFKNNHQTFTITFGKPIPWNSFDTSKTQKEWAQEVKNIVYSLNK